MKKMYYRNLIKNFSEKFYKVTFSGLDKFYTSEKLKILLSDFNEVKIHRSNKSTNKNYCHIDLSTHLNSENLRSKFEGMKILGKSVKVRIKELTEDLVEIKKQNYNSLDIHQLNNVNLAESMALIVSHIKHFYVKNLTDNPSNVKNLLDQFDKSNSWLEIIEYKLELFDLQYKLQIITDSSEKFLLKNKNKHQTYFPIKTLTNLDTDEDFIKQNTTISFIKEKLKYIFEKLGYSSYNTLTNTGEFRDLQIKFIDESFMVTLMVSRSKLSDVDLKIINEAIKFEFRNVNNISFYICINEKVHATFCNSNFFHFINGKFKFLNLSTNNDKFKNIKIYPYLNDANAPVYLKSLEIHKIFNLNNFKNIIDFSSNYAPLSILLKDLYFDKIIFNEEKSDYDKDFKYFNDESDNFENIIIRKKIDEISTYLNLENDNNLSDNLVVLNLKILKSHQKLGDILHKSKYHVLISNTFSQILDFLKNYSFKKQNLVPLFKKLIFVRDSRFEVSDVILAFEIIKE